ncbi:MAG TPA: 6-phosphofructokinase [Polyangiales bacterium]|nr:6-phosphofructokinase [Polyangiales bacterium]
MFELSIVPSDLRQLTQAQLDVRQLGPARLPSPLTSGDARYDFGADRARVVASALASETPGLSFEKAGPRREIFFEPAQTRVGIVSCGGLCPGTNSVIRSAVLQLHHAYKVRDVLGFRFGFEGLSAAQGAAPISLTPALVSNIHLSGGSVLGFGRGAQSSAAMVQRLRELEVSALIVIGGDGTLRGAHALAEEAARAGYRLSVVGVPKIDPSYMIRSVPSNASDNRYCDLLASHAVHAALAGKTDLVIGHVNGNFVHVPLALVSTHKRRIAGDSELWYSVTSTTGQPALRAQAAKEVT